MNKEPELPNGTQFENVTSPGVFDISAKTYANEFTLSIGYTVAEAAIVEKIAPYLITLHQSGIRPSVLEVGAGTGQSTRRIEELLQEKGIIEYDLIATEPSAKMIAEGRRLNEEALKYGKVETARIPDYQAAAEKLPVQDNSVHLIIASHVLHWIDDIPQAFTEAKRVLISGGMLVHATGGIIEDPYFEEVHFAKNPAYKLYLEEIKQILVERNHWNEAWGEFVPTNPKVNSFFNRYTSKYIESQFITADFTDMTKTFHRAPLDKKEMLLRMTAAAISIFIFGGEYANAISEEEREEIANTARKNALQKATGEALQTGVNVFDNLSYSSPEPEDSTMLYTVKKW